MPAQKVPKAAKTALKRGATTNNEDVSTSKKSRKLYPLQIPKRPSVKCNLLVCGSGDVGQLGLGSDASNLERRRPTLVPSIKDAADICAGGMHTLVLTSDGQVYSFGCNDEGALGRDSSEEGQYEPDLIDLPEKVVMISAGDSHSACLLENGAVMAWGSFRDSHGNMGLTLDGNKRVPYDILPGIQCSSIASGADHLAILTRAGHVYSIGCAEQGQLGRVSTRSAGGEGRRGKTAMLRPQRVYLRRDKLADAIWATNYCTFVRESRTGLIFAFGLNNYKQLVYYKDENVVGNPVLTNCKNVKKIAGGQHHTIILQEDDTIHTIGHHNYGRLGLGDIQEDVAALTCVEALQDNRIIDIACGDLTSFAITDDGKLYSWGLGTNNQLGTGSEKDETTPVLVDSKETQNKRILRAASGGQHSVFLVQQTNATQQKENNGTG